MQVDILSIRISVLEAVLERGRPLSIVVRRHGLDHQTAFRWVRAARFNKGALSTLRKQLSQRDTPLEIYQNKRATFRPSSANTGQLLKDTAPFVLHPASPIEEFQAWLAVFVRNSDTWIDS